MTYLIKFGLIIVAYIFGSIPWGYLIGKMRGIDIRDHGSKNIGATNIGRVLGFKYAFLAFFLDTFKGFLFVFLFRFQIIPAEYCFLSPMVYGFAAILGHSFSLFLKFRGGKAVATSAGVILGFAPWLFLIGIALFFVLAWSTKLISLSSLLATGFTLIMSLVLYLLKTDPFSGLPYDWYFPLFHLAIYAIIVFRHRENIKKLLKGTESKFSFKK
jgi:glycerol-3-phosphate acyltransferase PlsY